jgi:hypothetical protein
VFFKALLTEQHTGNASVLFNSQADRGVMEQVWIEHNDALAHLTLTVLDYLKNNFT